MMDRDGLEAVLSGEFRKAREARDAGNGGKTRVCARRAAGAALGYWLERHPRDGWGVDAVSRLRAVAHGEEFPEDVRTAAVRLTARVTESFTSRFEADPLEDALRIIRFFTGLADTGSP